MSGNRAPRKTARRSADKSGEPDPEACAADPGRFLTSDAAVILTTWAADLRPVLDPAGFAEVPAQGGMVRSGTIW
jgi:hypothetical protein